MANDASFFASLTLSYKKSFLPPGMKSRNEIGKNIFDLEEESFETVDDGWNRQTLSAVEDNTVMVRQREREIQKIVQSIAELNAIFKDLATMVSEQVMSQTRDFFGGGGGGGGHSTEAAFTLPTQPSQVRFSHLSAGKSKP